MKIKDKTIKNELFIKIIILLILLILLTITTFNTGRKFYLLKNTYFENTKGNVDSNVARWEFSAKVKINGKEMSYDK